MGASMELTGKQIASMMRRRKIRQLMMVVGSCALLTVLMSSAPFTADDKTPEAVQGPPSPQPHPLHHSVTMTTKPAILQSFNYSCTSETLLGQPEVVKNSKCTKCKDLTCKNILHGESSDKKIYQRAREFMKNLNVDFKKDEYYLEATSDCSKFKKDRGYILHPVSTEEANYPIAFNLLVHTNVQQIERLLRSIYRPQNVYCMHPDANQPETFQKAIRALAKCFPNVFISSKVEHIVYAGFTRLKADINCMEDLVKLPKSRWNYLINLAGQAFPIRTNAEMVKILKIYNGANDIEGMYKYRVIKRRFESEWKESKTKVEVTGKKNPPPPHDIDIVRGSAYGIFSRGFVDFLLTDQKAKDLLEWSRKTYSPDEHYWSTLHHTYSNPHLKSPGSFTGLPQEKPWLAVYVAWGGEAKCYGKWRRGVCVLGVEDLPSVTTKKHFFVNKFYQDYQPIALDCMEKWIDHNIRCPPELDLDYYKKLAFVKKDDVS